MGFFFVFFSILFIVIAKFVFWNNYYICIIVVRREGRQLIDGYFDSSIYFVSVDHVKKSSVENVNDNVKTAWHIDELTRQIVIVLYIILCSVSNLWFF